MKWIATALVLCNATSFAAEYCGVFHTSYTDRWFRDDATGRNLLVIAVNETADRKLADLARTDAEVCIKGTLTSFIEGSTRKGHWSQLFAYEVSAKHP